MLPASQRAVCLSCHGTAADLARAVREGRVAPHARPPLLGSTLDLPSTHPLSRDAYSSRQPGDVVCTSCHSPHRGRRDVRLERTGGRRLSTKNDGSFEYQLCESCHGSRGATTQSLADISRLLSPTNRSYHPVEAPSREGSPSVLPSLDGAEINCTDCHDNSDAAAPRGPHGSLQPFILRAAHPTVDGAGESALCYRCHRRDAVLGSRSFPEHRFHILEVKAACATCHNPHGSVENRALVRFGEQTDVSGVLPSAQAGRLAFVSSGPGSGSCYLSCHGKDHPPLSYGAGLPRP
jgi:hypothetical protein